MMENMVRLQPVVIIIGLLVACTGCDRVWTEYTPRPLAFDGNGREYELDVHQYSEYPIDIGCGGPRQRGSAYYRVVLPYTSSDRSDRPSVVSKLDNPSNLIGHRMRAPSDPPRPWSGDVNVALADVSTAAADFAKTLTVSVPYPPLAYWYYVTPDLECVVVYPGLCNGGPTSFDFAGRSYPRGNTLVWFGPASPSGTAVTVLTDQKQPLYPFIDLMPDTASHSIVHCLHRPPDGTADELTLFYRTGETRRRTIDFMPFILSFERSRLTADEVRHHGG